MCVRLPEIVGVVIRLFCSLRLLVLSPVGGVQGRNLLDLDRATRLRCAPYAPSAVLEQTHALEVRPAPAEPIFDQAATAFLRRNRLLLLGKSLGADDPLDDLLNRPT